MGFLMVLDYWDFVESLTSADFNKSKSQKRFITLGFIEGWGL